ncbi:MULTISPECIES: membrane protein insertase YidC [Mesobacillus]|uniref:Membrane protein insertase YidC n=2 Tax=Mesobacillus TaxID=2675231 RepID=A0A0D6ZAW7_9BACI|nr:MULTISPECIES: membrane protein insertase YidC [Mesobacillus]KIY22657.1 OxaA-like protein precursor [Mesobacillus subterraneus]MDQ0411915.1 YidC/Oxa1 family membrane protein insertase [Mesobacillus stamsii]
MKKLFTMMIVLMIPALLTGCQSLTSDGSFFQTTFINPFTWLIKFFAGITGDSYGLAIIFITLLIRLILMPLMLKQYKSQQSMKEKMEVLKPEMDEIQKKLKDTKDSAEQKKLQQEMMGLYQKHGVNPLSVGCLPMLIQMPILMGLYYAISNSTDIASHSFLWFNLGHSDVWITAAAGVIYYLQFKVSMSNVTEDQKKQMKLMGLLSPAMIVLFSLNAPSALPLYWTVGGIFLIVQTLLAKKVYAQDSLKVEKLEKTPIQ